MTRRELVTRRLSGEELRQELAGTLDLMRDAGIAACGIAFGFAWAFEYYADDSWEAESIQLERVWEKIEELETRGLGRFGDDDIVISIQGMELRFCHESDVHLTVHDRSELAETIELGWQQRGLLA